MDAQHIRSIQISHPSLASVFSRYWNVSLRDYSSVLYREYGNRTVDPLLISSFRDEFVAFGLSEQQTLSYIDQLLSLRTLQITHHVTPTNGPTFLGADIIALAGLPKGYSYLVGAVSGLPYSNPAMSGCLLYSKSNVDQILQKGSIEYREALRAHPENSSNRQSVLPSKKVSLIPSRMRNALVYPSTISKRLLSTWNALTPQCHNVLHAPSSDSLYSYWACKSCAAIQRKIFGREDILYFDINRVVSRYLYKCLEEQHHPFAALLLDGPHMNSLVDSYNNPTLFLGTEDSNETPKVVPYCATVKGIRNENNAKIVSIAEIKCRLLNGTICPSMLLITFALRFINGIRCLGGYRQVEYIEEYRRSWRLLNIGDDACEESQSDVTLTTGRVCDNGYPVFPLDLVIANSTIDINGLLDTPMSYFWTHIANHLSMSCR